jgi:signal transduction histidine kinase
VAIEPSAAKAVPRLGTPQRLTRPAVRIGQAWELLAHSLSGRLLLLTLLYVLLTEVLIFVPSLGRDYRSLLETHIDSAEIAILPFTEAVGEGLSEGLRHELLARAGAMAVMLKRPDQTDLFLAHDEPSHFDMTIDLRNQGLMLQMADALNCLFMGGNRTLNVIGPTRIPHAQNLEVITEEAPIRSALLSYAGRLVLLALLISVATAVLVFLSLYLVLVRPMGQLTRAMVRFREDPEDASRIVTASERRDEIGTAERELASMQRDIFGFLQQKARLAALGSAVAKIQHDLRNMLASAQLASDRLARVDDPVVQHLAPRLVASLDHAVTLATRTLRFGRADEHPPHRAHFLLRPLLEEIADMAEGSGIAIDCGTGLELDADREQIYRILLNLARNAAEAADGAGRIELSAERVGTKVAIHVRDFGPGIPDAVRDTLFQPFTAAGRPGGTGLGLAIARDLARAHGGDVVLEFTGENGTSFRIDVPDRECI